MDPTQMAYVRALMQSSAPMQNPQMGAVNPALSGLSSLGAGAGGNPQSRQAINSGFESQAPGLNLAIKPQSLHNLLQNPLTPSDVRSWGHAPAPPTMSGSAQGLGLGIGQGSLNNLLQHPLTPEESFGQ